MEPKQKISKHFTLHEALWLPAWQVYHVPSAVEMEEIVKTAEKLDAIREHLGKPIIVHCWIRPSCVNVPNSKWDRRNYNSFVGGAPGSAHQEGKAVDFHASSMVCDEIRYLLLTELKVLDIRMENNQGNWVHIDTRQPLPGKSRFFRP